MTTPALLRQLARERAAARRFAVAWLATIAAFALIAIVIIGAAA